MRVFAALPLIALAACGPANPTVDIEVGATYEDIATGERVVVESVGDCGTLLARSERDADALADEAAEDGEFVRSSDDETAANVEAIDDAFTDADSSDVCYGYTARVPGGALVERVGRARDAALRLRKLDSGS